MVMPVDKLTNMDALRLRCKCAESACTDIAKIVGVDISADKFTGDDIVDAVEKLKEENRRLERELFDEQIYRANAVRAHAVLTAGIKHALKIEQFPDFYRMYGAGWYADGVARYLNEEVDKLRANQKKKKS